MKKQNAFLVIICLFLGAVFTQVSAQTFQGWDNSDSWVAEVYCDGILTDYVELEVKYHWVYHEGKDFWLILQMKGTAISAYTGEVFKYKEIDKKNYFDGPTTVHYNLKGNMGNHYIGTMTVDFSPGPGNEIFTIPRDQRTEDYVTGRFG